MYNLCNMKQALCFLCDKDMRGTDTSPLLKITKDLQKCRPRRRGGYIIRNMNIFVQIDLNVCIYDKQ